MPEYQEPNLTTLSTEGGTSLRDALNDNFDALKVGITGSHSDAAATWNEVIGVGRVVGSDVTAGEPVAGTGLSLRIENGTRFIINGTLFTVDGGETGYIVITDVPALKDAGVYGYLSADEEGNLVVADEDWYDEIPSPEPAGLPLLGKVFSSGSAVTDIEFDDADIVQTQDAILARLEALEATVSGLEGSGEGGGGSVDLSGIEASITSILSRLTALENAASENVIAAPQESEIMQAELLRLIAVAVHQSPETANRVKAGVEIPGLAGDAEIWANGVTSKVTYAGGNAVRDEDSRSVHG